jgi:hypothetical protein
MSIRLGVCQIIEGNDLHLTIKAEFFIYRSECQTSDTTKTINANTNGHSKTPITSRQIGSCQSAFGHSHRKVSPAGLYTRTNSFSITHRF